MKLNNSRNLLGTITGKLKTTPEEAFKNWGFIMRTDCTCILFRGYTFINNQGKKERGTFISNFKPPSNPGTPEQGIRRDKFKAAVKHWQELPEPQKTQYNKRALRKGISGFNLHNREFLKGII